MKLLGSKLQLQGQALGVGPEGVEIQGLGLGSSALGEKASR